MKGEHKTDCEGCVCSKCAKDSSKFPLCCSKHDIGCMDSNKECPDFTPEDNEKACSCANTNRQAKK